MKLLILLLAALLNRLAYTDGRPIPEGDPRHPHGAPAAKAPAGVSHPIPHAAQLPHQQPRTHPHDHPASRPSTGPPNPVGLGEAHLPVQPPYFHPRISVGLLTSWTVHPVGGGPSPHAPQQQPHQLPHNHPASLPSGGHPSGPGGGHSTSHPQLPVSHPSASSASLTHRAESSSVHSNHPATHQPSPPPHTPDHPSLPSSSTKHPAGLEAHHRSLGSDHSHQSAPQPHGQSPSLSPSSPSRKRPAEPDTGGGHEDETQAGPSKRQEVEKPKCGFYGCGKEFQTQENLVAHQIANAHQNRATRRQNGPVRARPLVRCTVPGCKSGRIYKENISRHHQDVHGLQPGEGTSVPEVNPPIECPFCERGSRDLRQHVKRVHKDMLESE